jgi:hypothetical protein
MNPFDAQHTTPGWRSPAPSYVHGQSNGAKGVKVRTMVDLLLMVALVTAILTLYAAMLVGLYRWSHDDPLLPPDSATVERLA